MAGDGEGAALKLRIFVFERVEAVRTGGHNLLEVVLGKRLDVFGCRHLEQVFFAGAAREFAVAALLTHDGELDACGVENFHHSARNLLSAAIVTSRTADPIEHVVFDAGLGDFNVKSLGPLQAASGIHTPGIADARSVFQSLSQTFGEVAFFKRQMTAHLNDDVGSRNLSRTNLGAGAACGAAPKGVLGHNAVDQRLVGINAVHAGLER